MEERLPPSVGAISEQPGQMPPPPGAAAAYVVQIPRDQVCRVPPSDHASIVEVHIRNAPSKKSKRRRCYVPYTIPIVLIVAVVAGMTVLAVRATVYRPTPPQFSVTRLQKSNATLLTPDVDVGIRAENKNPRMKVTYLAGGSATLVFDDKQIMQGKIPTTIGDGKDGAADFAVELAVNWAALSSEIKKKLDEDDDKEKLIELTLDLPMEVKSLLRNERMNMKIYCDVWVRYSLLKNSQISFQECQTDFLK